MSTHAGYIRMWQLRTNHMHWALFMYVLLVKGSTVINPCPWMQIAEHKCMCIAMHTVELP